MASATPALRVTWTPPQSDMAISHYQVEYRRSGTASWSSATPSSVVPPATSTILSGLDAGTDYSVRVRAVSEIGAGQWSAEQTEKTTCSKCCHYLMLCSGQCTLCCHCRWTLRCMYVHTYVCHVALLSVALGGCSVITIS